MSNQKDLGFAKPHTSNGPVECLGQTFANDDTRRKHFLALLAKKLKDPEFRKTSGFPKGSDEDILRISDPPYYTACPNPFLEDFVKAYGRPYDPAEEYKREPFAVDVSVGKTDQLYKAHGYHTKVPHLAIVPSILHYTNPGDIVLDGFCGSGMTGVAAQWCGTAPADYRRELEAQWQQEGHTKPEWGARRVILGDLGPAATFIAANYNIPFDVDAFGAAARRILDEVDDELGWMYETLHTDGKTKGRINYTVWSEVFSCPECSGDVVFLEQALDRKTNRVRDQFPCPGCRATLNKTKMDRLYDTRVESVRKETVKLPRRRPVLINYTVATSTFEKPLDSYDRSILERIDRMSLPLDMPANRMMNTPDGQDKWGDEWRAGVASFSSVHHLFLPRASHALACLWRLATSETQPRHRNILLFFVEQAIWGMSVLARYAPTHFSQVNQYMSGTIRILSQHAECSPWYILEGKRTRLLKAFQRTYASPAAAAVTTGDCARLAIGHSTIDYVFTDPPFGHNFAYAELNFLVESWHRVFTDPAPEAIVSPYQQKDTLDYQDLMRNCFEQYYRVLKPGRWMTVVFSNNSNAVWRAIQEALGVAGFVVADVRTLDKQQGSFNQVAGVTVNQDLVISAYKPPEALTERFKLGTASSDVVWAFVSEHLHNVPTFVGHAGKECEVVAERTAQMLHDRMVAFFVQRGVGVPISSPEFLGELARRYPQRDGMYFLPDQVAEYDRKRTSVGELRQLELFVSDEASATQWVRQQLHDTPQTFQELQPQFMQQLQAWAKHERTIELKEILELNFLEYDGSGPVPNQIHSYLSTNFKELRKVSKEDAALKAKAKHRWYVPDPKKEGDLDQLRLKTFLKEFEEYRTSTKKKIKQFRTEAVRAGFKHCYDEQDYRTIVDVAAKLPEEVIQEDEKLLMYYDVATMRLGDGQ